MPSASVSSSTMPIRSPATPSPISGATGSKVSGIDVESIGSGPLITSSRSAASATSFANGPIWSSELANAMSP